MSVSEDTIKKTGHRSCSVAGSKDFQSKNFKKNLERHEVLNVGNNLIYNL